MIRKKRNPSVGLGILAALCLGSAAAAPPDAPGTPEIVAALFREPPGDLAALEKIVGPIRRDRSKWEEAMGPLTRTRAAGPIEKVRVELAIDFYHFDPHKVEDPQLGSYQLDFREGRLAVRGLLEKLAGPQRELADGGRRVLRFKDFYYQESAEADGFSLAWYRVEPDFAVPRRTEQETVRLVKSLAVLLRDGISRAAIKERFGKLTPNPGWNYDEVKGADWELHVSPLGGPGVEEVTFETRRAIPGKGIVRALGLKEPGVIRTGLHVLESLVIDVQGIWLPIVHGYAVEVELDPGAPLVRTARERGPQTIYQSRDYPIQSLRIWRQPP
jgi:hypothetical protein